MRTRLWFFIALMVVFAAMGATLIFTEPVHQSQAYHCFADRQTYFHIPNFWNVISNVLFLVFGFWGIFLTLTRFHLPLKHNLLLFFIGITFTGIGSAYYHWQPNDARLLWDRLPMTVAFMAFFSFVVGVFVNTKAGKQLLWPCILFGLLSIVYWLGQNDLRLYAFVQFMPIILTVFILLFSRQNSFLKPYVWGMIICYTIAKVFEQLDAEVFSVLSGHTLKHIVAACSNCLLIIGISRNYPVTK
jgi:hypothetical protein